MTNYTFGQIYEMPIMEFFMYTAYLKWKAAKQEQQIREFKMKNKH